MRSKPLNIIFHMPESEEGKAELAHRVAKAHAQAVTDIVRNLNCSQEQKMQIIKDIAAHAAA